MARRRPAVARRLATGNALTAWRMTPPGSCGSCASCGSEAGLESAELAARAHYPHDVIVAAEAGPGLPELPVLSAYVRGCGGGLAEWEERWRSVTGSPATSLHLPARPAGCSSLAEAGAQAAYNSPAVDPEDQRRIMAAITRAAVKSAAATSRRGSPPRDRLPRPPRGLAAGQPRRGCRARGPAGPRCRAAARAGGSAPGPAQSPGRAGVSTAPRRPACHAPGHRGPPGVVPLRGGHRGDGRGDHVHRRHDLAAAPLSESSDGGASSSVRVGVLAGTRVAVRACATAGMGMARVERREREGFAAAAEPRRMPGRGVSRG